ncbi:MAG: cell division protein FtsA [Bdellovibrionota bacterium]|nr:cell division protein FtsA [Deltaproteobacteria bacterium]
MSKKDNLIVGLDIGTTKICTIVGELTHKGVDIVGLGTYPSNGLRKGVVINIDATVQSIQNAVEESELMAGCDVHSVYAGIAGGHIKGFNSHGVVAVKNQEVTQYDVDRVIDAAKAVAIPMDREVLHVLPQEYIIDDQDGIREPIGMSGVRLESKVHIVTGAVTSAQNIVKCANRCGLNVSDIVIQQLASSKAVLMQDERDLGVAMVDIGGGTTDILVYSGGAIVHSAVISVGGNHITNDIAVGIRTPMREAESIKHKHGVASTDLIGRDEIIDVASVGGRKPRQISKKLLSEIIEPRVEELFMLVKNELEKMNLTHKLASGVVITGGSSIMEGMPEVAEAVFDLPVRRGIPHGVGGLAEAVSSPIYATAVGLVLYGSENQHRSTAFRVRDKNMFVKVRSRMKEWFGEFF